MLRPSTAKIKIKKKEKSQDSLWGVVTCPGSFLYKPLSSGGGKGPPEMPGAPPFDWKWQAVRERSFDFSMLRSGSLWGTWGKGPGAQSGTRYQSSAWATWSSPIPSKRCWTSKGWFSAHCLWATRWIQARCTDLCCSSLIPQIYEFYSLQAPC